MSGASFAAKMPLHSASTTIAGVRWVRQLPFRASTTCQVCTACFLCPVTHVLPPCSLSLLAAFMLHEGLFGSQA